MNTLHLQAIKADYEQSPTALRWKHRQAYGPPGERALLPVSKPSPTFQLIYSGVQSC